MKKPFLYGAITLILILVAGGLTYAVLNTPSSQSAEEQPDFVKASSVLDLKQLEVKPSPMANNLLPAGLPNITRSPLKAKYACQIWIDGEVLDIKSLKWVDDFGKVVYTGSDFESWDLTAINKNHFHIRFGNVSLTSNPQLADWMSSVSDKNIEKKDIQLVILDSSNKVKARWRISSTWPVKWTGPDLKADGNAVAIECLELEHEGLDRMDDDDD